ncbi:MAG TPA: hypothetical protein VGI30_12835 [Caulobacteraceae bacterium]|jgi:hypothetical protein
MKRLAALAAVFVLAATPPPALSAGGVEAAIVRGASASALLQAWCSAHGLPPLVAQRLAEKETPADPIVRAVLRADPGRTVRHRHVRLACGGRVLSEADNWYLPDRLTQAMNRALDATDAPFGLVVRPLKFSRQTLQVKRSPDADHALEVRAALVSATGARFSYVVEDYSPDLNSMPGR